MALLLDHVRDMVLLKKKLQSVWLHVWILATAVEKVM